MFPSDIWHSHFQKLGSNIIEKCDEKIDIVLLQDGAEGINSYSGQFCSCSANGSLGISERKKNATSTTISKFSSEIF